MAISARRSAPPFDVVVMGQTVIRGGGLTIASRPRRTPLLSRGITGPSRRGSPPARHSKTWTGTGRSCRLGRSGAPPLTGEATDAAGRSFGRMPGRVARGDDQPAHSTDRRPRGRELPGRFAPTAPGGPDSETGRASSSYRGHSRLLVRAPATCPTRSDPRRSSRRRELLAALPRRDGT